MASDDDAPLKLNATLSLSISWTLRIANRPFQCYRAELPRDLALVGWLLRALEQGSDANGEIEISEKVLEAALATGLLVTPATDPGGDVLAFACALDPSLLDLVPAADRAAAETVARADDGLVLNPRRWLQASAALPYEIADRVVLDESLRDRVGHPQRGPREGIPRGLGPRGVEGCLWVEHPETCVLQPYELDRSVADVLERLASGTLAPRELPAPLLSTLLLSDVLLPAPRVATPGPQASLAEMRELLARQRYLVLPRIVSPLQIAALRRHYRSLRRAGHLDADAEQVKGKRDGIYCDFISLYLQDQLCRWLNGVVPQPIKSTYTWFFRYHSGAVLARHRDRAQCRWNVSFAIDSEPEVGRSEAWPFYVRVGDETRAVTLGPGDAVLYSGTELEHWRDALPPEQTAGVCFLHYVEEGFEGELG